MLAALAVTGTVLAACSSTASSTPPPSSGTATAAIPAAAFKDTTGLTSTTVRIGNVSTDFAGLFQGATVGTQAYADYVNSTGGINGRKLVVDAGDDGYNGPQNKQLTQSDVANDFALVGGFSLQDNFGGQVLAQNPSVPNVAVSLDLATAELPNSFSPQPTLNGWQTGPLDYFKTAYPEDVKHAGALIANQPSAIDKWNAEKATMEHLGYTVSYVSEFPITQSTFDANVIAMKNAGVKILFLEQMPDLYAGPVMKALAQQNFHPQVVWGASTYSSKLISLSGGPANTNGTYLEQTDSLYLGQDASQIPAIGTFLHWVQQAKPGFAADLYTLYGWLSAELFSQALKAAGPNPTRGSVLQQLRGITSFTGGNIVAPVNPAAKTPATCYIIAKVVGGNFVRVDDPPISGSTHGYRCDGTYYVPKNG
ncbi:MAG: ABC transporter substrate-binding protein [Actinomycetota bacterium]|nr:ABC transporter substrate-binding protein [Actinomycetota bacterium]